MMQKFLYAVSLALVVSGSAGAVDETAVKADVLVKSTSSWDGKRLPAYPDGQPEVTVLKIEIPPKVAVPLHQHPVINAGVLLKGELTVVTDGPTLHLKAGDSIVELVDTWHYGINEGNETAEIIVFYAGIQGRPVTVKKEPLSHLTAHRGENQNAQVPNSEASTR